MRGSVTSGVGVQLTAARPVVNLPKASLWSSRPPSVTAMPAAGVAWSCAYHPVLRRASSDWSVYVPNAALWLSSSVTAACVRRRRRQ
jgi:hypothetical protein